MARLILRDAGWGFLGETTNQLTNANHRRNYRRQESRSRLTTEASTGFTDAES
jgi:hypothetical protein